MRFVFLQTILYTNDYCVYLVGLAAPVRDSGGFDTTRTQLKWVLSEQILVYMAWFPLCATKVSLIASALGCTPHLGRNCTKLNKEVWQNASAHSILTAIILTLV